jgi:hypothetical protein
MLRITVTLATMLTLATTVACTGPSRNEAEIEQIRAELARTRQQLDELQRSPRFYSEPSVQRMMTLTRGPRGGCFVRGNSGRKLYVDRSLCSANPQRRPTD